MSGQAAVDGKQEPAVRVGSYVYGIVPAGTRLPEDLTPLPGGEGTDGDSEDGGDGGVGLVTSGSVAAIVSDVTLERPLGTRRDLMAHEHLLNEVARTAPVLPMRFGAVVSDDDAVADELLDAHHGYFVSALDEMRGLLQFSLRGDYDETAVLTSIVESDPGIQRLRRRIAEVDEDASYYDRVALGETISHAMDRLRHQDTDAALDALERFALATVTKDAGGEHGAVHIAFLVRDDRRSDFERAVDELGDAWSGRIHLRLIGPTAAFDFLPEFEAPESGG